MVGGGVVVIIKPERRGEVGVKGRRNKERENEVAKEREGKGETSRGV